MKNDISQYLIYIREPVTEEQIQKILEDAGIEVIGINWTKRWTDKGYWSCKPPVSSL